MRHMNPVIICAYYSLENTLSKSVNVKAFGILGYITKSKKLKAKPLEV
jgi:hypothetical protein